MMFSMPVYEARYNDHLKWKEISEIDLMEGLSRTYARVAPVIQQLLEGQHIHTPEAVYRLKGMSMYDQGFMVL